MTYGQWLLLADLLTVITYGGALIFLLGKGWILRAGLALLIIATFPVLADPKGGDGAYGQAFVMMPLLILPVILIAVGTAMGAVRGFKRAVLHRPQ